jgi:hypothetical protein
VLTVGQIFALADWMPRPPLRTFVLAAAMRSLRWGEITGLRRRDVEKGGSRIYITSQLIDMPGSRA